MIIFCNAKGEIHDVGSSTDLTLTAIEVIDGTFDGWTVAKICCYKVKVVDGYVVMLTPYVDNKLIEHIDQLARQTESITPWTISKTAYIDDTECVFEGVPNGNISVYINGANYALFEHDKDKVTVKFEPLDEVKKITISII